MSAGDLILLSVLPVLAIVSAFCAASETALFSLTHSDRLRMRRGSPGTERAVARLLSRPRRLLLSVLLLTNAANVAYFVVSAVLEKRIGNHVVSLLLNIGALLLLILVADLLPKLLARSQRVRVARILARPLSVCIAAISPLVSVLERWVVLPLVRLIRPASRVDSSLDADELAAVLELSGDAGEIDEDEQRLLSDVIEMGQSRVRDVMTPRVSVKWVNASASAASIAESIGSARRDWMPVFEGSMDSRPVGWLDVRAYLRRVQSAQGNVRKLEGALKASTRAATFIPERTRLDRAFEILRKERATGAMVVDEFGAFVGLVGVSGLVRQLVARVREAQLLGEGVEGEKPVVRTGERSWSITGRLPLRTLREFLGLTAPRGARTDASTIAGLVVQRLGRLPKKGDRVSLASVEVVVSEVTDRAVRRVDLVLKRGKGNA